MHIPAAQISYYIWRERRNGDDDALSGFVMKENKDLDIIIQHIHKNVIYAAADQSLLSI